MSVVTESEPRKPYQMSTAEALPLPLAEKFAEFIDQALGYVERDPHLDCIDLDLDAAKRARRIFLDGLYKTSIRRWTYGGSTWGINAFGVGRVQS